MKKLKFLFFAVMFFVLSCQQPENTKDKETKTIIKETYNLPGQAKIQKVFPVPEEWSFKKISFGSKLYATDPKNKDEDFADGRMYLDNSFPGDAIIHDLDMTPLIGNNQNAIVFLIVRWVGGCQDEGFTAYFRPKDLEVAFQSASCRYGELSKMLPTITNEDGFIQWYHDYTWNFLHSGVEKWMDVELWAVYYDKSGTVNN